MKKLAVLLQIVGILLVCPMYVLLEIRHSENGKSEVSSDSTRQRTGILKIENSTQPDNQSQNTYYPTKK